MSVRRLLISFSGGETSAYMTWWILKFAAHRWDEIVIVFANTGQENEATLEFVDRCDRELFASLGFPVVWIEAVQFPGERRRPSFAIVDFATADRDGKVFEASIAKYGVPNSKFKDCTRNLKRNPIAAYARSLGWGTAYTTAIGIRADEQDRQSTSKEQTVWYPLIAENPRTKPQINTWWAAQSFRLNLRGYQGNCKWCWKKSFRKHFTIMAENPEHYAFPLEMEVKYGHLGPEFLKDPATRRDPLPAGYRRVFFRESTSTPALFERFEAVRGTFSPASDDAQVFDPEFDVGAGCEESCEVFGPDDAADNEEDAT